ncbi:helix-turn-helix domain-containing protein [Pedobacter sp. MR2016-19]|uniref:helix-turn-helix domain-containing protein n=1 Tax=Pedobacter sp. MR2016-19 TaxID=2780089 RepID=UPI001876DC0A|nr:helix-turn-helix domain-containing protein [Pedobacter sp. MR2016-19]MBE5320790.1 helix-turn-helix domain-containing protein [Pedobacter sp. MR2016-19]
MPHPIPKKGSKADLDYLLQLMNMIFPISDLLKQEITEHLVSFEVKKDEVLVEENSYCHYMYFILKGALMGRTTYNGKKIVTYMSIENEFVSSISGLHGTNVSKEEISAIEDCSIIAIHNDVLQRLFLTQFDINYLFRVMVEKYYMDAQERTHIVRVGSAKERFLYFAQTKPGYMERLPLEYVASLLDMKPLTLINIKKQHELNIVKDKETADFCVAIERCMAECELFKDKDISLQSLSKYLNFSTHKLSSLLNNQFQQKFIDFVNTHRINHIKAQIAVPGNLKYYTIATLANNAGFSSRSAFYKVFKKMVGMSPVEYAKSLAFNS